MKKITSKESIDDYNLPDEIQFDFSKAKPNRFVKNIGGRKVILLDSDVAKIFSNAKIVNDTLRSIINIMPKSVSQRKKSA